MSRYQWTAWGQVDTLAPKIKELRDELLKRDPAGAIRLLLDQANAEARA